MYGVLLVIVLALVQSLTGSTDDISYSRFRDLVQQGRVTEVTITTSSIEGKYLKGDDEVEFTTNLLPVPDDTLDPRPAAPPRGDQVPPGQPDRRDPA